MLNHCVIFAAGLIAYISSRKVNPWLVINSVCKSPDLSRCSVISHQLLQRGRGLDVTGGGGLGGGVMGGVRERGESIRKCHFGLQETAADSTVVVCLFVVFLTFLHVFQINYVYGYI